MSANDVANDAEVGLCQMSRADKPRTFARVKPNNCKLLSSHEQKEIFKKLTTTTTSEMAKKEPKRFVEKITT